MGWIVGEIALLGWVVRKVEQLVGVVVMRLFSGRRMLGMGSPGDGAQVAEMGGGVGIDRGDPSFDQPRIPLLQTLPPFFDGHILNLLGIADGQIFPVPHSNGAGEAHFGIKHTVFRRGRSEENFPEALSIKCLLGERNACEFQDGRREIHIADKRTGGRTTREASLAPDDARILETALVERAFGIRAVIVEEKNDRVVELAVGFQAIHHRANGVIQREHHRGALLRIVQGFFRQAGFFEAFPDGMPWRKDSGLSVSRPIGAKGWVTVPGSGFFDGAMRKGGRHVEKERFFRGGLV